MKKIFAITLLSGFILFNLISMVNAYYPTGGNCNAGDIQNPDSTTPDCITPKSTTPSANQSSSDVTKPLSTKNSQTGLFESTCNPGYRLTNTLNTGEAICLKEGAATPGSYEVKLSNDTVKTSEITPSKQKIKGYTFYAKIPCQPIAGGTCPSNYSANPANYIARVYQFGLMIAGLAAFGNIVFGALQYVLSAGNIGSQGDATDRITQSVFGLVLLLGAYLILYTINPNLVSLTNPNMPVLNLSSITGAEDGGIGTLGGAKEEHPLCQTGTYTGITVTSGINIGGRTPSLPSFICEKCKAYAEKDGIGECKCIPSYYLSSSGNTCISGISKGDEACTSKGGDCVIKGSSAALDYCPSQKYDVSLCEGNTSRQCCLP